MKKKIHFQVCALLNQHFFCLFINFKVVCQITKRTNLKIILFLLNIEPKTLKISPNQENGTFWPTILAPIIYQM